MLKLVRYLRIVFSAFCGLACVLLIALWVRSYWDWLNLGFSGSRGDDFIAVAIIKGEVYFSRSPNRDDPTMSRRVFPQPLEPSVAPALDNNRKLYASRFGVGWREFGFHLFGYSWFYGGWQVSVSLWWPTLISVALAAAPWLRWRFHLRTLLVATTLVAVGLGLIVYFSS